MNISIRYDLSSVFMGGLESRSETLVLTAITEDPNDESKFGVIGSN